MTNKKMTDNTKIILASGSPRRKELLSQAGLEFSIFKRRSPVRGRSRAGEPDRGIDSVPGQGRTRR